MSDFQNRHRVASVIRALDRVTQPEDVFDAVAPRLRQVVPFDGELWLGADPATGLASFPLRAQNIAEGSCDTYWQREFLVDDALLFRDVARAPRPVATLRGLPGQAWRRSARFHEFLAPQGYGDELRAAFRAGDDTWGYVSLLRTAGRPAFSDEEVDILAAVVAPVGEVLRASAVVAAPAPMGPGEGPGLMVFDDRAQIVSLDDRARAWLDELPTGPRTLGGVPLPSQVTSAVSRARAVAEGRASGPARLRVRSRSGRWLVVHASCLRLADGRIGQTALIIEPARAAEIAPLVVMAYELSAREEEITRLIARGASTGEMAARLFLSPHTVRDHVKAIFEKVGVSSRGELVAKIFADHFADALHAAA